MTARQPCVGRSTKPCRELPGGTEEPGTVVTPVALPLRARDNLTPGGGLADAQVVRNLSERISVRLSSSQAVAGHSLSRPQERDQRLPVRRANLAPAFFDPFPEQLAGDIAVGREAVKRRSYAQESLSTLGSERRERFLSVRPTLDRFSPDRDVARKLLREWIEEGGREIRSSNRKPLISLLRPGQTVARDSLRAAQSNGYSLAEIANHLGVSKTTAWRQVVACA